MENRFFFLCKENDQGEILISKLQDVTIETAPTRMWFDESMQVESETTLTAKLNGPTKIVMSKKYAEISDDEIIDLINKTE